MRASTEPVAVNEDIEAILAEFLAAGRLDDILPGLARDRKAIQRIEASAATKVGTQVAG